MVPPDAARFHEMIEIQVTETILIVPRSPTPGCHVSLHDLFIESMLDSIFKVGFGIKLNTLSASNKEGRAFAEAFDDSSARLLSRHFDVLWKFRGFRILEKKPR